jgi:hypothetical protein
MEPSWGWASPAQGLAGGERASATGSPPESSIAFAGAWLVEEVKRRWPGWERRVYTGYDYE